MSIGWYIGLAASSAIFFAFSFIASRANYKKRFNNAFDIRNHFPYELNFESPFSLNLIGNLSLIMSVAFSVAFFALSAAKIKTNGFVIYSLISGIVYSLLVGAIHFVPLKTIKTHLVFSVILFGVAFITPCAIGLCGFNLYQDSKETYPLVLFIVSMVVGGFFFILAMNPKLTLNIKMIVGTDEKGNEIYIRPKYIVLALTEWLNIFGLGLSHILLILLLIAIK